MSESVFVGLNYKFGTSEQLAMRRDVVDITETLMNRARTRHDHSIWMSGSQREGIRKMNSDIDVMYWQNNYRVIWDSSQCRNYKYYGQTLILSDCSDSLPGHTLLQLLTLPLINTEVMSARIKLYGRHYISSSKYRQIMCSTIIPNSIIHGPCSSGFFAEEGGEYDIAHSLTSDFWPPSAYQWITRCHSLSWPPAPVVDDIVKSGCHFVPIGPKLGYHEDHEWRISFSVAEYKLLCSMNHCQFLTYGLLKLFLKHVINKGLNEEDKLLSSYNMKTAVFWVVQQNTIPQWCPQNLLECFWVCFKLILKWVYEGDCPNFFIPQNNMFRAKIYGEAQKTLFFRLESLYKKGIGSLLLCPSVQYILDIYYDPRHPVCTDEHSMCAETRFDLDLLNEIQRIDSPGIPDLKFCVRYLLTAEQLISLPLTKYHTVTLQRLLVVILQKTAFMLHMNTNTGKNKTMYKADKISCHMLKLAAKFGYISDMSFIALYYYKTLRYMEALSIIEMIKVKLAQPYVMYMFNVEAEMYLEAVGGQSWSTKIRQAIARNIRLYTDVQYISELIPEQQVKELHQRPDLILPLYPLLHMLEFLSYRHSNVTRAHTSLQELELLLHNDEGELVGLNLRGTAWQILAICQQVTGNLYAALKSYQQALSEIPFNEIRNITMIRIMIVIYKLMKEF
ncbi:uncharacterized protein LOC133197056 [Saccostrea echinata]|uniref:uncharacterized protein LOC133197056 n=1 Tax=Saccostrea echinata TaxID=191078 RepID=UPI002A8005A1|nr:uncharacterized protein LOC133197056 [Saccostrea echinata]